MNIEFFKNNKKIKVDNKKINFEKDKLIINKYEEGYIIRLDFKRKKCILTLINENISTEIEVINMDHQIKENIFIFTYELISEKGIKNKIIITS